MHSHIIALGIQPYHHPAELADRIEGRIAKRGDSVTLTRYTIMVGTSTPAEFMVTLFSEFEMEDFRWINIQEKKA